MQAKVFTHIKKIFIPKTQPPYIHKVAAIDAREDPNSTGEGPGKIINNVGSIELN